MLGAPALPATPRVAPASVLPPPPRRRFLYVRNVRVDGSAGRGGATAPAVAVGRAIAATLPERRLCGAPAPSPPLPPPPRRRRRRHEERFGRRRGLEKARRVRRWQRQRGRRGVGRRVRERGAYVRVGVGGAGQRGAVAWRGGAAGGAVGGPCFGAAAAASPPAPPPQRRWRRRPCWPRGKDDPCGGGRPRDCRCSTRAAALWRARVAAAAAAAAVPPPTATPRALWAAARP